MVAFSNGPRIDVIVHSGEQEQYPLYCSWGEQTRVNTKVDCEQGGCEIASNINLRLIPNAWLIALNYLQTVPAKRQIYAIYVHFCPYAPQEFYSYGGKEKSIESQYQSKKPLFLSKTYDTSLH